MKSNTMKLLESINNSLKEDDSNLESHESGDSTIQGKDNKLNFTRRLVGNLEYLLKNAEKFIKKYYNEYLINIVDKYDLQVSTDKYNIYNNIDELINSVLQQLNNNTKTVVLNFSLNPTYYGVESFFTIHYGNSYYSMRYDMKEENKKPKESKTREINFLPDDNVKNDGSKYYFILNPDTGYLLNITKEEGYYSGDSATWHARDAEFINEAKKFNKYDSAYRMMRRGNSWPDEPSLTYENKPFDELENLKVVSLNQLISGEVTTKTDLSSIKQNDTKVNTNASDEEFESNEVEYTFTTEDGKDFTCTVEYENEPVLEDMPAFIEAVEYSEDKGFNKITSMYGDMSIEWVRNKDGEWIGQ